jgi:hypothetical protein
MWQVYLYLANEYQARERQAARTARTRRWSLRRGGGVALRQGEPRPVVDRAKTPVSGAETPPSSRVH